MQDWKHGIAAKGGLGKDREYDELDILAAVLSAIRLGHCIQEKLKVHEAQFSSKSLARLV